MTPLAQSFTDASARVVLVVDDEPLVRELACEALSQVGFQVLSARSGPEALEVARSAEAIDVLFTDIQMPGEPDGVGLAARLRELMPDVGVVVSSGRMAPAQKDLPKGAVFLPKPWGVSEIITSIAALMPSASPGLTL